MICHEIMLEDVPLTALRPTERVGRLLSMTLGAEHTWSEQMPRLAHAAYQAHPYAPWELKRAHVFCHMLDNMTLYILPGELLVGNRRAKQHA